MELFLKTPGPRVDFDERQGLFNKCARLNRCLRAWAVEVQAAAQMCRCVCAVFSASKNGACTGLCSDAARSATAEQERARRWERRRVVRRHLEGATSYEN